MIIGILLTTVALAWQCDHESTWECEGGKLPKKKTCLRKKPARKKDWQSKKKDHESSWAVVSSRESGECEEAQKVKVTLRAKHKWGWGEHHGDEIYNWGGGDEEQHHVDEIHRGWCLLITTTLERPALYIWWSLARRKWYWRMRWTLNNDCMV